MNKFLFYLINNRIVRYFFKSKRKCIYCKYSYWLNSYLFCAIVWHREIAWSFATTCKDYTETYKNCLEKKEYLGD